MADLAANPMSPPGRTTAAFDPAVRVKGPLDRGRSTADTKAEPREAAMLRKVLHVLYHFASVSEETPRHRVDLH